MAAQHLGTPDSTLILVVGDKNHGVMVGEQTTNWLSNYQLVVKLLIGSDDLSLDRPDP